MRTSNFSVKRNQPLLRLAFKDINILGSVIWIPVAGSMATVACFPSAAARPPISSSFPVNHGLALTAVTNCLSDLPETYSASWVTSDVFSEILIDRFFSVRMSWRRQPSWKDVNYPNPVSSLRTPHRKKHRVPRATSGGYLEGPGSHGTPRPGKPVSGVEESHRRVFFVRIGPSGSWPLVEMSRLLGPDRPRDRLSDPGLGASKGRERARRQRGGSRYLARVHSQPSGENGPGGVSGNMIEDFLNHYRRK